MDTMTSSVLWNINEIPTYTSGLKLPVFPSWKILESISWNVISRVGFCVGGPLLSNEIGSGEETSSWVGTSTGTSFEILRSDISSLVLGWFRFFTIFGSVAMMFGRSRCWPSDCKIATFDCSRLLALLCLGDGVFAVDPCGICVGVNEFRGDGVRVGVFEIEIWLMCVGDSECRVGVSRPADDAVVLPHLKISISNQKISDSQKSLSDENLNLTWIFQKSCLDNVIILLLNLTIWQLHKSLATPLPWI